MDPGYKSDAYRAVDEFGHWLGLGHGEIDGCQQSWGTRSLNSPAPTNDILTMCFYRPVMPPVMICSTRTPSQDGIQGLNAISYNDLRRMHSSLIAAGLISSLVIG